jgi:peptidyl-prolyl cis-trans isomerase A (cyclophilin A)
MVTRLVRIASLSFFIVSLSGVWACEAEYPEPRFHHEKSAHAEALPAAKPVVTPPVQAPAAAPVARASRVPTSPDPLNGTFTLAQALADMPKKGKLHASIESSLGTMDCVLFEDKAPLTVANFIGLARGLRPFWDGKQGQWVKRPLYDGTTFHRLIPDFVIQGGDHMGDGTGDVGFNVIDELHPSLKHDKAGLLCMANKGPNTNGGQFFITDAPTPNLDAMHSYSIFGECKPLEVIRKIARVPKRFEGGESPATPVEIKKVTITRK